MKTLLMYASLAACLCLPLNASYSDKTLCKIERIERIIQKDPGNRGVSHFYTQELAQATETLEKAKHVAILTGFFIPLAERPETDGPLGTLFLAQSLAACGKKVTVVTDTHCLPSVAACYEAVQGRIDPSRITLSVFPELPEDQKEFVAKLCSQIDCLVSIERVGRSSDGSYRSMRGIDISPRTAPLDDLFLYAGNHPELGIATIGVGDGGNEIGMGGKYSDVQTYIPRGPLIGCVVPADYLIVTGVSNWGGYALAAGLACALQETSNTPRSLSDLYPSTEEQLQMLTKMVEADCCDGVLGKPALSVDGMGWEVHSQILEEIRSILTSDL